MLSAAQRAAATRVGQDVCVMAGPGSGKTRVLVERFAWLVDERKVQPSTILAFTFTEKAANEIRKRLAEHFQGRPALREEIENAWVSTIHSFCARLLREHAVASGVDPAFAVWDEIEANLELGGAITQALDELAINQPAEFRSLAYALNSWDIAAALAQLYQAMRIATTKPVEAPPKLDFDSFLDEIEGILRGSRAGWTDSQAAQFDIFKAWAAPLLELRGKPVGMEHLTRLRDADWNLGRIKKNGPVAEGMRAIKQQRLPEIRSLVAYYCYLPQRQTLETTLNRAAEIYEERKRARSALDFADLEHYAIRLLKSDAALRGRIQSRFQAILMDEMQDTNPLQWELVELLRTPERFFAVGDVNQSIYGFRHADPQVLRRFSERLKEQQKATDTLRENHRSRPEVLRAVEAVLRGRPGIEAFQFEPKRCFKEKRIPSVEVIVVTAEGEDKVRKEAAWMARRIRELMEELVIQERKDGREIERPLRYSDIAILLRKGGPMEQIEATLREFGVPCVISRGSSFFDAQEVSDLLRLLHVIENPRDEISLAAVLLSPLVGLRDETLVFLKKAGNLADGIQNPALCGVAMEECERLQRFWARLRQARALAGYVSPDYLLAYMAGESGVWDHLPGRAGANVDKLFCLLRRLWAEDPLPLRSLLKRLQKMRDAASESEAPPSEPGDVVRMMSIHAAKGLEFPVVFLSHVHAGVVQSADDLAYSKAYGLGVRWVLPDGSAAVADAIHAAIAKEEKRREEEEADRLLFVAMTRAEQHLVITGATGDQYLSKWPKVISSGLGFEWEGLDKSPVVHKPPERDFEIRLFRTNATPENPYGPAAASADEGVVEVAPPERADQFDSTASITALVEFSKCPRRWFLGNYLGFQPRPFVAFGDKSEEGEEPAGMEFGTLVHRVLAGEAVDEAEPEAWEMAERFRAGELGRRAAAALRMGRETPFVWALEDVVLRGQVDLWFEETDGQLVIVDYKTDRLDPKIRHDRLEAYSLQLRFYAAALSRQWKKPVKEAWVYLLREGEAAPAPLGGEEELRAVVQEFCKAQDRLDFPMREGPQCHGCQFHGNLCPGLQIASPIDAADPGAGVIQIQNAD